MIIDRILSLPEGECPPSSLDGYFEPTDNQKENLLNSEGRLQAVFTDTYLVEWGNPIWILATATIFRLGELGFVTIGFGLNSISYHHWALALADLSVTGETNYRQLQIEAINDSSGNVDISLIRQKVNDEVGEVADRIGISFSLSQDVVSRAVDYVIDRSLVVIWALNGPKEYRDIQRPNLGWIAVDSEKDPPHTPVNIPSSKWPTSNIEISVNHASRTQTFRIRYSIAGSSEQYEQPRIFSSLPVKNMMTIPDDAMVIVFLHGHSSRLEEGERLYDSIITEHENSVLKEPLVMLSFDFPSNGYSQYIDHDEISPFETTTRFVPDRPAQRRFGILEFYEKTVIALVESVDRELRANGKLGILNRIGAVVGGSMGGNLALRLSERLVTSASWLEAIISWSPACVNTSFGRADYFIPSPGEHWDFVAKEALERTRIRCMETEISSSRQTFFSLQIRGERRINDGTPGVEVLSRLAPWIAGIALGGTIVEYAIVIEALANGVDLKQSDHWRNRDCLLRLDEETEIKKFSYTIRETYNEIRRRTHWRVAHEQLLFSHLDEVADSRGMPCYLASEVPTLLVAGLEDVVDEKRFNIAKGVQELAPKMRNNPGRAFILEGTHHSIHDEQPDWLAKWIYIFITVQKYTERKIVAVRRTEGRITSLKLEGRYWAEIPVSHLFGQNRSTGYYIENEDGTKNPIIYRRFLTTSPDKDTTNNLRSLPITNLPLPITERNNDGEQEEINSGPEYGFRVTHIRLHNNEEEKPSNTWITHLCNDESNYQISTRLAEQRVQNNTAQYYLKTSEGTKVLRLLEFLTTNPDNEKENNLANLPDF